MYSNGAGESKDSPLIKEEGDMKFWIPLLFAVAGIFWCWATGDGVWVVAGFVSMGCVWLGRVLEHAEPSPPPTRETTRGARRARA